MYIDNRIFCWSVAFAFYFQILYFILALEVGGLKMIIAPTTLILSQRGRFEDGGGQC
jgi:hypothetical protein